MDDFRFETPMLERFSFIIQKKTGKEHTKKIKLLGFRRHKKWEYFSFLPTSVPLFNSIFKLLETLSNSYFWKFT